VTYKNRPEMPPATEVRRYLPLWPVVQLLRDRKLRLTLVDQLRQKYDPFEGSLPSVMIDDRVPLFSSSYSMMMSPVAAHYPGMDVPRPHRQDPWAAATYRSLAKLLSAHVSCWTAWDESEGMWRLYCNDDGIRGRGVAIQTTLEALEASVAPHKLIVSPITYRYYHDADRRPFNDELDVFMHKRKGFQHEREVRLLRYDEAHYHSLLPDWQNGEMPKPMPANLPDYIFLDWRPEEVIQKITISPYADDAYEGVVREAIARAARTFADRIEQSILDPRRFPVQH
jgi:hypothetical protein